MTKTNPLFSIPVFGDDFEDREEAAALLSSVYWFPTPLLREKLKFCTLVGIRDGTPISAIFNLARQYPYAEFGVAYSKYREGTGRYASLKWIDEFCAHIDGASTVNVALHVSGAAVSDLIAQRGHVSDVAPFFQRIRLDVTAKKHPLHLLCGLLDRMSLQTIITEHTHENARLWRSMGFKQNHAVLFDNHRKTVHESEGWLAPLTISSEHLPFITHDPLCGYAGGFAPHTISRNLANIDQMTGPRPFWISIETGLHQSTGEFDVPMAQKCLQGVEKNLRRNEEAK